jgi:hypothetical protein
MKDMILRSRHDERSVSRESRTFPDTRGATSARRSEPTAARGPLDPRRQGARLERRTSTSYLRALVEYWQSGYDFRKHEARLNEFAQYKTRIGNANLHFIHEKGRGPNPVPLLLLHGWPDSFYRFHKVIGPLADPASAGAIRGIRSTSSCRHCRGLRSPEPSDRRRGFSRRGTAHS